MFGAAFSELILPPIVYGIGVARAEANPRTIPCGQGGYPIPQQYTLIPTEEVGSTTDTVALTMLMIV
jgi:hypothetical protein